MCFILLTVLFTVSHFYFFGAVILWHTKFQSKIPNHQKAVLKHTNFKIIFSVQYYIITFSPFSFDSGDSVTKDAVTFESQETYVTLPHQLLKSNSLHFSMSFKFKTSQETGLIMYSGNGPDFLALELDNGFLYYVYDMGGGAKRILVNTPEKLNDNKWHDVSLFRPEMDEQRIRIDNNPSTVEDMKGYSARHFDLKGPLYLGGLIKTRYYTLSMKTIASRNGFLGCLASLDINGERINILKAATFVGRTDKHSVIEGCSGKCHHSLFFSALSSNVFHTFAILLCPLT